MFYNYKPRVWVWWLWEYDWRLCWVCSTECGTEMAWVYNSKKLAELQGVLEMVVLLIGTDCIRHVLLPTLPLGHYKSFSGISNL
ncbi:hypothetical protein MHYP_G00008070 [Metynnis hypsauchen]